jgi:hypothetical protein
MRIFLNKLKYRKNKRNNSGELLKGNIFINKQKNINYVVLNKNIKNVMEIGFNSGFTTLCYINIKS